MCLHFSVEIFISQGARADVKRFYAIKTIEHPLSGHHRVLG
jgi:hypothetical protein